MKIEVIADQQTPFIAERQNKIEEYINENKNNLLALLEYAKTRDDAVGLAANQISIDDKRLMVRAFALRKMAIHEWSLVIDPVITKFIGMTDIKAEGCLTWKNKIIVAKRYRAVEVRY